MTNWRLVRFIFRSLEDKFKSLESDFLRIQKQLRQEMNQAKGNTQNTTRPSTPAVVASPQPSSNSAIPADKEDSPYLRLASCSVGLTHLMRAGKVNVLEEKPKLMGNLQKLSIFADKPKYKLVQGTFKSGQQGKENAQEQAGPSATSTVRSDRFKIENRLKSGALKRPAPYNPPK